MIRWFDYFERIILPLLVAAQVVALGYYITTEIKKDVSTRYML